MTVVPESPWLKSSYSNGSCACVEIRSIDGYLEIRDSKYQRDPSNDPAAQPIIRVDPRQFDAWLRSVRGLVEETSDHDAIVNLPSGSGAMTVMSPQSGVRLVFTDKEWVAFVAGVEAGEFELALA